MDGEMKKQILALINDDKSFNPIAEDAFNAVDTDKSGEIDKDEFKQCAMEVAKGFGLGDGDQSSIDEVYAKLDADGSGAIDVDEFKKYVKQILLKILENM
jgi:Ca2+-binding EF-hand superfamily protein